MHHVAATINKIREEQGLRFYEREDFTLMLWLAITSGEHGFVIGEPGTGKSEQIRDTFERIIGARHFEIAMSKFRSEESVYGPIDIKEFRDNGHMFRKRKGFIQDAHFIFVDEIGRMNPILGDEMLALYNERRGHEVNGGRSWFECPLMTGFSASNTMLTDGDSDDAAALWDRQLFRTVVEPIRDDRNLIALLRQDPDDFLNPTTLDFVELEKAVKVDVPAVTLSEDALQGMVKLKKALANEQVNVSTRRWNKAKKALKAHAFLDGRDVAYEDDLAALKFVLWETLPQIEKIERLTAASANPYVSKLLEIKAPLQEIASTLASKKDKSTSEKAEYAREANGKLMKIRDDLVALRTEAGGRVIPKFADIAALLEGQFKEMYESCFEWEEAVAVEHAKQKMGALAS